MILFILLFLLKMKLLLGLVYILRWMLIFLSITNISLMKTSSLLLMLKSANNGRWVYHIILVATYKFSLGGKFKPTLITYLHSIDFKFIPRLYSSMIKWLLTRIASIYILSYVALYLYMSHELFHLFFLLFLIFPLNFLQSHLSVKCGIGFGCAWYF